MKPILDKIVAHKLKEVEVKKELYPTKLLESSIYFNAPCVSLIKYIRRPDKFGIIAEFKRRSPSKPEINIYANIEKISIGYMMAGASALSVLTDEHFFGGSSEDLTIARKFNFCPILRKDFIIDEYQIIEARSIGADTILLIAAILDNSTAVNLASFAQSLGMEVLMEIHDKTEIERINQDVDLIGVNNRDLKDFSVDPQRSIDLYPLLPDHLCKISESGIHDTKTIYKLRDCGYEGFLIGERFMRSADPVKACERFIQDFEREVILNESIANPTP